MKFLLCGIALTVVFSFVVQAKQGQDKQSAMYTYKCYMQLQDNREVIRDYRRQPKNQNANLEKLLSNQMVTVEKGQRLAIVNVLECVEFDKDFSNRKARELDKLTLR